MTLIRRIASCNRCVHVADTGNIKVRIVYLRTVDMLFAEKDTLVNVDDFDVMLMLFNGPFRVVYLCKHCH